MSSRSVPFSSKLGDAVALVATALLLTSTPQAQATLVFTKDVASGQRTAVYSANDDGSNPHRLAYGHYPRISPDGTTVAFAKSRDRSYLSYDDDLYLVPVTGGKQRRVATHINYESVRFSPDSRKVAASYSYTREDESSSRGVVVVDAATGSKLADIATRGEEEQISFAPTSDTFVYTASDDEKLQANLFSYSLLTGQRTRLATSNSSSGPLWGQNGIAYMDLTFQTRKAKQPTGLSDFKSVKSELKIIQPDSTNDRKLPNFRTPKQVDFNLVSPYFWLPNGIDLIVKQNAFTADQPDEEALRDTYYLVDTLKNTASKINALSSRDQVFGISKDGGYLLVERRHEIDTNFDKNASILRVPLAGGKPQVLARKAYVPDWTG